MKGKPRSRTVTISKIYTNPKELKKMADYSFYSFRIKLEDGTYANINISAKTEEEAADKADQYFIVDKKTNERILEDKTYTLFEESTDEDEKYWKVKAFTPLTEEIRDPKLGTDSQLASQAPKESMKEVLHKEKESAEGSTSPITSYKQSEERKQTLIVRQSALNYATQLVTVFATWDLQNTKDMDETAKENLEGWSKQVKAIAKEYEEQILRLEK